VDAVRDLHAGIVVARDLRPFTSRSIGPVSAGATESERIWAILRAAPLIDGHNDLPWEIRKAGGGETVADVSGAREDLMTDVPRMAAGCVGNQFWSVYVRPISRARRR
jgi:hypothetical protein